MAPDDADSLATLRVAAMCESLVAQEAFDNHCGWRQGEAPAAPMPPQAG